MGLHKFENRIKDFRATRDPENGVSYTVIQRKNLDKIYILAP